MAALLTRSEVKPAPAAPDPGRPVLISVVSHGHGRLVRLLLEDLAWRCDPSELRVVLTLNLPEPMPVPASHLPYPLHVARNPAPLGFAANHNAAFRSAPSEVFCVLNPDIRCPEDPLPPLRTALQRPGVALAAPRIVSPAGSLQDSARRHITPLRIARRVLGSGAAPDYPIGAAPVYPDWVAGMFMALRSEVFARVGGFDERYRLYCEDADLCTRIWRAGGHVLLVPEAWAIHDARRRSHQDTRYLLWHLSSLLRFCLRYPSGRRIRPEVPA